MGSVGGCWGYVGCLLCMGPGLGTGDENAGGERVVCRGVQGVKYRVVSVHTM